VVGDWEGDLIVGRLSQSAIATLVDRTSRFVKLVHLPRNHTAETVRDAVVAAVGDLPADARRTLTWDQGAERAYHHQIAEQFEEGLFLHIQASRGSAAPT
jgi:transposase, IS30 family